MLLGFADPICLSTVVDILEGRSLISQPCPRLAVRRTSQPRDKIFTSFPPNSALWYGEGRRHSRRMMVSAQAALRLRARQV